MKTHTAQTDASSVSAGGRPLASHLSREDSQVLRLRLGQAQAPAAPLPLASAQDDKDKKPRSSRVVVVKGDANPQSNLNLFLKARGDERAEQMLEMKREKMQRDWRDSTERALEVFAEEVVVTRPAANNDNAVYLLVYGATPGGHATVRPMSPGRSVRIVAKGTGNPGDMLVLADGVTTAADRGKVRSKSTLTAGSGTYRLVGIAEEAFVDGQLLKTRPTFGTVTV